MRCGGRSGRGEGRKGARKASNREPIEKLCECPLTCYHPTHQPPGWLFALPELFKFRQFEDYNRNRGRIDGGWGGPFPLPGVLRDLGGGTFKAGPSLPREGTVFFPVGISGLPTKRPSIPKPKTVAPAPRASVPPVAKPTTPPRVPTPKVERGPVIIETDDGDFTPGSIIWKDKRPTDWEKIEREWEPEPSQEEEKPAPTVTPGGLVFNDDRFKVPKPKPPPVTIPRLPSPPVLVEETPPSQREDEEMAIDWGDVIGGAIGTIGRQLQGPAPYPYMGPIPQQQPRQVTVDTLTGQVKPCRRRRRRRLLTPTDLSDLAALAAVVGKGDALKMAVAKAVRR